MKYITWLKLKAEVDYFGSIVLDLLKKIATIIITLARFVIYCISSIGTAALGIAFPFGMYFCYTVIKEYFFHDVPLMETTYMGFFLLFFVCPLVLGVIREISKPW